MTDLRNLHFTSNQLMIAKKNLKRQTKSKKIKYLKNLTLYILILYKINF